MQQRFGKGFFKSYETGIEREWVQSNGIGGYAGSTIIGALNRKHHGLLIASLHAPVQRYLILSKIDETVVIDGKEFSFKSAQRVNGYDNGHVYLQQFLYDQLPTYQYQVRDLLVDKTIAMAYGQNTVAIMYTLKNGHLPVTFKLEPLFNFRDHNSESEKSSHQFTELLSNDTLTLIPKSHPTVKIQFNYTSGHCQPNASIYDENMVYQFEIETGTNCIDNHYKPYQLTYSLAPYEEKIIEITCSIETSVPASAKEIIIAERQRINALITQAGHQDLFANRLVQAADQFIVQRHSTQMKTILAGLPWFADWGRDTMIALQGLTLITKRFEDAKEIIWTFAKYVKNGLVPNMFPDAGEAPLYNTVDASLWYFYSVHKFLEYYGTEDAYQWVQKEIFPVLEEILTHYENGTDFSIKMDTDGLIMAGSGVDQVTWMDVRVGEWVVTPRHGKPVEISALWYNALRIMETLGNRFNKDTTHYVDLAHKVLHSFNQKFWNESTQCLFDVVDANDPAIRPNQIWAISLPYAILPEDRAKKVVEAVYFHLYASYGLRSLSPYDPQYKGIYYGQLMNRDGAYHQGTTWAFPLGGFITAYCKVNHYSNESVATAKRLLEPMMDHLNDRCIGSISEIFDGNDPIISRGCYAQAWSVGEILRAYVEDILNKGQLPQQPRHSSL